MFLLSKNIIIIYLNKKLDNKILGLFKIIVKLKYSYYLKFLISI